LIYVRLQKKGQWIDLWLFTTLEAGDYPVELLVKWHGQLASRTALSFRENTDENGRVGCPLAGDGPEGIL
jgi:hypothetical protein